MCHYGKPEVEPGDILIVIDIYVIIESPELSAVTHINIVIEIYVII